MKKRPLFLLVIFVIQLFSSAGLIGNGLSKEFQNLGTFQTCTHELKPQKLNKEDVKPIKEQSCCQANKDKNEDCKADNDSDDKSCCGDDCDCQCCTSIHVNSIQFSINNHDDLLMIHGYLLEKNEFYFSDPLSFNYSINLLNPPKLY